MAYSITQIDEVIVTSTRTNVTPSTHSHGWLDNNGQNDWETWTTYAVDVSANIWKLELSVATSDENIRYLYDVSNIKKQGGLENSAHSLREIMWLIGQKTCFSNSSKKDKCPLYGVHMEFTPYNSITPQRYG
jgi:hypothetical protein